MSARRISKSEQAAKRKRKEAAAKRRQFGTPLATMNGDDFAVDIPTIQDLDELPPGYDRGENW